MAEWLHEQQTRDFSRWERVCWCSPLETPLQADEYNAFNRTADNQRVIFQFVTAGAVRPSNPDPLDLIERALILAAILSFVVRGDSCAAIW
jgi:hypothetical protein